MYADADPAQGGALYAADSPWVKVYATEFTQNGAQGGDGGAAYIVGITATAWAPLSATTTLLASAALPSPAMPAAGVAIELAVSNFTDNAADNGGGAVALHEIEGGVLVSGNNFAGNMASAGYGGGIRLSDVKSSTEATILTNNTYYANSARQGGGVHLTEIDTALMNISASVFTSNLAFSEYGGGLMADLQGVQPADYATPLLMHNVEFTDNSAGNQGGAVFTTGYPLALHSCTFKTNTVSSSDGYGYAGGAVYANAGAWFKAANTTFDSNSVSFGDGGALILEGFSATAWEALYDATTELLAAAPLSSPAGPPLGVVLELRDSAFTANSAERAGAVGVGTVQGGVLVSHCTFSYNEATLYTGGALQFGGVSSLSLALIVESSTFLENRATQGSGGGVYMNEVLVPVLKIVGCNMSQNSAGSAGGGVHVDVPESRPLPPLIIADSVFDSNTATTQGGAISCAGYPLSLVNTSLTYNLVAGGGGNPGGGAVHASYLPWVKLVSSTLSGNLAYDVDYGGGGILVLDATGVDDWYPLYPGARAYIEAVAQYKPLPSAGLLLQVSKTQMDGHFAPSGAAVYVGGGSGGVEISSSHFISNYARLGPSPTESASALSGGAVYLRDFGGSAGISITATSFEDCYADLNGGGVMVWGSVSAPRLVLSHVTFRGTRAESGRGGGLMVQDARGVQGLELRNCSFINTYASLDGPALAVVVDDTPLLALPPPDSVQAGQFYVLNVQGCSLEYANAEPEMLTERRMNGLTMGMAPRLGGDWGSCRYISAVMNSNESV